MSMYYVTKKLKDAAIAHRLRNNYPGKCKNLHGHNYKFEVVLSSNSLDEHGMVLDFGIIKNLFDTWIQHHWDHATLVSSHDRKLFEFLVDGDQRHYLIDGKSKENNTTAEWMSKYLFNQFHKIIKVEIECDCEIEEVRVWETDCSYATYKREKIC